MIHYSLKLKVPKNVLEKRVVKANKWLCEEIIKDTDQFVPARTGALAMNVHRQGNTIVYASPYARMMYYGKVMVDPKTGAAGFLVKNKASGAMEWKSRKGVRKVVSSRPIQYSRAMHPRARSHWFEASKALYESHWLEGVAKKLTDE